MALFFCTFFFLLLCISGSILYQYFGWHLPEDEDEHGHENGEQAVPGDAGDNNDHIEMTNGIKSKEKEIYVSVSSDEVNVEKDIPNPSSNGEIVSNEKYSVVGEKI